VNRLKTQIMTESKSISMKNPEYSKQSKALKSIKWVLFLGVLLFLMSCFMPFYKFYDTEFGYPDHGSTIYGYESGYIYAFALYFVFSILSILTFNETVVHVVSPILLVALLATIYLNIDEFIWSGGSFFPDFRYGFYIHIIVTGAMIISSYYMLDSFKILEQPRWLFKSLMGALIGIPILIFIVCLLFFYSEVNKPKMIMEQYTKSNGKELKEELWEWKGENARFNKYYSRIETTGISQSGKEVFELDSIQMTFSGQRTRTETRKAINGKLELEDFLEDK